MTACICRNVAAAYEQRCLGGSVDQEEETELLKTIRQFANGFLIRTGKKEKKKNKTEQTRTEHSLHRQKNEVVSTKRRRRRQRRR